MQQSSYADKSGVHGALTVRRVHSEEEREKRRKQEALNQEVAQAEAEIKAAEEKELDALACMSKSEGEYREHFVCTAGALFGAIRSLLGPGEYDSGFQYSSRTLAAFDRLGREMDKLLLVGEVIYDAEKRSRNIAERKAETLKLTDPLRKRIRRIKGVTHQYGNVTEVRFGGMAK